MIICYISALCIAQLFNQVIPTDGAVYENNLRVSKRDEAHSQKAWGFLEQIQTTEDPITKFDDLETNFTGQDNGFERMDYASALGEYTSNPYTSIAKAVSAPGLSEELIMNKIAEKREVLKEDIKAYIKSKLFDMIDDALVKSGAKAIINVVLDTYNKVTEQLTKYVTGIFNLSSKDIGTLEKNLDPMFKGKVHALNKYFDDPLGICAKEEKTEHDSTEKSELLRNLFEKPVEELLEEEENVAKGFDIDEMQTVMEKWSKSFEVSLPTSKQNIVCTNGKKMELDADRGTVCVNVNKKLIGGRFMTDSRVYLEAPVYAGIQQGVTIPNGDSKISANAGFSAGFGKSDMEKMTAEREMIRSSSNRELLNMGTFNKLLPSHTATRGIANKKYQTKTYEYEGDAGVKIYLPGFSSAMDGWGGFDIGFTLKAFNESGVILHLRHPWYTCDNLFKTDKWTFIGFTVNYFRFKGAEDLTNKTKSASISKVMTHLKTGLGTGNIWENYDAYTFSIGSHFLIGLNDTRCDWDFVTNFKSQPYASGTTQCGRRRVKEDMVPTEETRDDEILAFNDDSKSNNLNEMVNIMSQSRAGRELQQSKSKPEVIGRAVITMVQILVEYLGEGGINVPFCFGKCASHPSNADMKGSINVEPSNACNKMSATGAVDEITFSNLGYLLLKQLDQGAANWFVKKIGLLGKIGVKSASITFEITMYPKVAMKVMSIGGKPQIPTGSAGFEKTVFDDLNGRKGLTIAVNAYSEYPNFIDTRFTLNTKPFEATKYIQFEDKKGTGIGIYTHYRVDSPKNATLRTHSLKFGINLPLHICTSDCDKPKNEQERIFLHGAADGALQIGASPQTLSMNGTFTVDGTWNKALGIPIIHILSVVSAAKFDIVDSFPPIPNKFRIFGTTCLGAQDDCDNRTPKHFVDGKLFLNLDADKPKNNAYIGMITTLSIEHILNLIGGLSGLVEKVSDKFIKWTPKSILRSGIYPFHKNVKGCDKMRNDTALAIGDVKLNLDCFAYIGVSKEKPVEIKELGLTIPKGISFSGRLNVLGYDVRARGIYDPFMDNTFRFNVYGNFEGFKLGSFLEFGERYADEKVVGDAKFRIDFQDEPQKRSVFIQCALYIPFIKTYADIQQLEFDDKKASYKGHLEVFGGIFTVKNADLVWYWDKTYFLGKFGTVKFLGDVLKLEDVMLEVDMRGLTFNKAYFSAQISVLNFVKIGAGFGVERKGLRWLLDFSVTAELMGFSATAKGKALLDMTSISNTRIADISYELDCPQWAKDILNLLGEGINELREGITDVISFAADMVQEVGDDFKDLGKEAVSATLKGGVGVGKGLGMILTGNIGGGLKQIGSSVVNLVKNVGKSIVNFSKAVWNNFVSVGQQIGRMFNSIARFFKKTKNKRNHECCNRYYDRKDDIECPYRRRKFQKWQTFDSCWGKWKYICRGKSTSRVWAEEDVKNSDYRKCVDERKKELDTAEELFGVAININDAVMLTKKQNEAILYADTKNLPGHTSSPEGEFKGTVYHGTDSFRTEVHGTAEELENSSNKHTYKVTKDMQVSTDGKVQDSVDGLKHATADSIEGAMVKNSEVKVAEVIKVVKRSGGWNRGYANEYNEGFNVDPKIDKQEGGICGVYGQYSKEKKDRQYKFDYCAPGVKRARNNVTIMARTNFTESWERECPEHSFLTTVKSFAGQDDRSFSFHCHRFEGYEKGRQCKWSNDGGWFNTWKQDKFQFNCGENFMLSAIKSTYSSNYGDRLYTFKCCHFYKASEIASEPFDNHYLNEYMGDQTMSLTVTAHARTVCGVSSHHFANQDYEDRKFKFQYCYPKNKAKNFGGEKFLVMTTPKTSWKRECPKNSFISYITSHYDAATKDRSFIIYCGTYDDMEVNQEVCFWSNGNHWLNAYDEDFTFACGSGLTMTAIETEHSLDHSDRRYKFLCCRMQDKTEPFP